MSEQLAKLEEYERFFHDRYVLKKKVNAVLCFLLVFCGISALLWSALVLHDNLIDRLRYMTFDGTIFTTLISLMRGISCVREERLDYEVTDPRILYLRLFSATTELVIFAVVIFELSPLVPDRPDVSTYTGIMMHLVMPFTGAVFLYFQRCPIGRLKPIEIFQGTAYITRYAGIMLVLYEFRILPSRLAPYSFLNFDTTSLGYKLACLAGIYAVGYAISWFLSELNRKLSWVWFARPKKKSGS